MNKGSITILAGIVPLFRFCQHSCQRKKLLEVPLALLPIRMLVPETSALPRTAAPKLHL